MPRQPIKLKNKKSVAKGTLALYFERPSGFTFKAGQYANLIKERGECRTFSIASSPHEKDLMFATRLTNSSFKNFLEKILVGEDMFIKGPGGDFFLPEEESQPVAIFAGGIGITPARSMLLYEDSINSKRKSVLFYSNNKSEEATFVDDIKSVKNLNFVFVPIITNPEDSKKEWWLETRYVDQKMLEKYIKNISHYKYYIIGASGYIESIKKVLSVAGVDGSKIEEDEFSGYQFRRRKRKRL